MLKYIEKMRDDYNNIFLGNQLIIIYFFFLSWSKDSLRTTFFLLLILFLLNKNIFTHIVQALKNKVVLAFTLYFGIHFVGTFFSADIHSSISAIKDLKYLIFPIIFYSYMNSEFIHKYFYAFISGMLLSELYSYGIALDIIHLYMYDAASPSNPTPFLHHVMYGLLMAFTASLLIQETFLSSSKKMKYLFLLFLVTLSFNIFLNAARSGFYLYVISVFITIFLLYKNHVKKAMILSTSLSIGVLFLAYYNSDTFVKRINVAKSELSTLLENSNYHSSWGNRVKMQLDLLQIIDANPNVLFFGAGTGQTMPLLREYALNHPQDNMYEIYIATPGNHNQYFDSLIQFGLVGFLLLLNIFYQIFRYQQPNKFLRISQIVLTTLFIFYSFHENSIADHIIGMFFVTMITATLIKTDKTFFNSSFNVKQILKYFLGIITIYCIAFFS